MRARPSSCDADIERFCFIDVNPRIQIEQTAIEQITGIDIAKAQLRISEGARIGNPESAESAPPPPGVRSQARFSAQTGKRIKDSGVRSTRLLVVESQVRGHPGRFAGCRLRSLRLRRRACGQRRRLAFARGGTVRALDDSEAHSARGGSHTTRQGLQFR